MIRWQPNTLRDIGFRRKPRDLAAAVSVCTRADESARFTTVIWISVRSMPSAHDRGGLPSREPVDQTTHEWADWEHLINALLGVLRRHDLINVDELRRGIEAMPPAEYESSTYYERWSASIETILVEKGILSADEIAAAVSEIDSKWE